MAELVDAQVSGICVRKDVEVRVFLRAPLFIKTTSPLIGYSNYPKAYCGIYRSDRRFA